MTASQATLRARIANGHPMFRLVPVLCCLAFLFVAPLRAQVIVEAHGVADLFRAEGLQSTFVLATRGAPAVLAHDAIRAARRFMPASTFKIPNTLIGLATGAVASGDEVLPFGGGPQFLPQGERDMPLREAMPLSNVPVYQGVARHIGLPRMRAGVGQLA